MSTIRLARILNTAISFFSKKAAGARKGILLAVMGACAWGAWADEEWPNENTGSDKIIDITTAETITLKGDTELKELWIHANDVVIDLAGYTLTVEAVYLGGANNEETARNASVTITDNSEYRTGLFKITNIDVANRKETHFILANNVTVKVVGNYWFNTDNGGTSEVSGTGFFDVSEGALDEWGISLDNVIPESSKDTISVVDETTEETGIETDTYYWTGAIDNDWLKSGNWAANPAGTAVKADTFPCNGEADTAIFTSGATPSISVSLTDDIESITVINTSNSTVTINFTESGFEFTDAVSTFSGNFTFTGSFTASSTSTYFLDGNVDLSACTTFDANGGKIYFYNTKGESDSDYISLKTPSANFNDFYFAGWVNLYVTNGGFSCENFRMEIDSSRYLSKSFTARVTGKKMTAVDAYLTRCSGSSGVYGTLEIASSDFTFTKLNMRSGTNLKIDSSSVAAITNFEEYSTDTFSNSITVEGTLNASDLPFSAYSNLIVKEGGSLTAASITSTSGNQTTITNNGTFKVTGAIGSESAKISTITNEAGTMTADSVNATSLKNYATLTASSGITANSIFSNNLIKTANLTADDFKAGTTDARAGKLEITDNGRLSITNYDASTSWLNNVIIDSGKTLTLENDITVYGNWTNNNETGGLDSNSKTITFAGEDMTVSGSQTFANAVFSGSGTEITGANTFSTVTFNADTSISGNNTFTNFLCTTGGVTLTFGAGKTQTVSENFTITGASADSPVTLQSSASGSEWRISTPIATASVSYATVSDSVSTNYAILAQNSVDSGNNTSWNFEDFTYTWTGASSSSPTEKSNWSPASLPGTKANVLISDPTSDKPISNYPKFSLPTVSEVKELTIGTVGAESHSAYLHVSGTGNLKISGSLTNYGSIKYSNTGKIVGTSGDFLNDVVNDGTVEYLSTGGSESLPISDFGDLDYANLVISASCRLDSAITVGGKFTVSDTGTLDGANPLVVSGAAEISGAIGSSTPLASLSVSGESLIESNVSVTGVLTLGVVNSSNAVTLRAGSILVSGSSSFADLTIASASVTFSEDNSFGNLTFNSGCRANLGAGKIQAVTGTLSSLGTSENPNLLTTTATSPSETDDTGSASPTWWILNIPSDKGKAISSSNFAYTTVSYSKSVNDITHEWDSSIDETPEGSTSNWFSSEYYWIGGTDETDGSKWSVAANWRHKDSSDNYYQVRKFPTYNTNLNTILIATEDGNKDLVLENDVSVKLLTVNEGKTIDLKGYKVNADDSSDSTADFVNNGTVWLYGVSGQIASSVSNGENSTIDYYVESDGLTSSLVWGDSYTNLNIFSPFSMSEDVTISKNLTLGKKGSYGAAATSENKFTVAGSTLIANGTGNTLSLTGENSFAKPVIITSGGEITLNSSGILLLGTSENFISCGSLSLLCDATSQNSMSITNTLSLADGKNLSAAGAISSGTLTNNGTIDIGGNALSFASYQGNSGGTDTIKSADGTITANGTSAITIGNLEASGSSTLNNTGTGAITVSSFVKSGETAGTLALKGGSSEITISSATYGGTAITGTGNVTLAGTENSDSMGNLTVGDGTTAGNVVVSGALSAAQVSVNVGSLTLGGNTSISSVSIASGASLAAGSSDTDEYEITVAGSWTNSNASEGFTANTGTVNFTGNGIALSGSQTFADVVFSGSGSEITGENTFSSATFYASTTISGSSTFTDFTCLTGGTTLTFGAGTTQTITDNFTIIGSDANLIILQSSDSGSEWTISAPIESASVSYAKIMDSSSANDSILALNSEDEGNNTNWNFSGFSYTWTGADSTDWYGKENWTPKSVPGIAANAFIPEAVSNGNYPIVNDSAKANEIAKLTIGSEEVSEHSAKIGINMSGGDSNFTVSGALTNYGTIEYSGTSRITDGTNAINDVENGGTVVYSGGTTDEPLEVTDFSSSGADYANLVVSGTAESEGNLVVGGNFTAESGAVVTMASGKTFSFTGDSAQNVSIDSDATVTLADISISGNKNVSISIESGATASLENFFVSDGASVTSSGSFTVSGNWTNENTSESGFTASDGVISFTGENFSISGNNTFYDVTFPWENAQISVTGANSFHEATFTGDSQTVTFAGGNTFGTASFSGTGSTVTFSADNTFTAAAFSGSSQTVTFSGTNDFATSATFSGESSTVTFSAGNTFASAAFTGANSDITFSDSNTFDTLSFTGAGSSVKFAAGKAQTVNISLSSSGSDFSDGAISLTSDSSSPSASDENSWWILALPNFNQSDISSSFPDFKNTKVSYAKTDALIAHDWGSSVGEGVRESTENWFLTKFFWYGTADSLWTNPENWRFTDSDTADHVANYPTYDYSTYTLEKVRKEIEIATASDGHDLVLAESIDVKNLTVRSGKTIDLKGYSVTADDSDSTSDDFINNGKVRLYGVSNQILSSIKNGSGSTVEYYSEDGSPSLFAWGNSYENLVILSPFEISEDVSVVQNLTFGKDSSYGASGSISNKFTVSGSTLIANGSGNSLSLLGENSFGAGVKIENESDPSLAGGNIVINSDGSFSLGYAECDSLEIQTSVTLTGILASDCLFTGDGAQINGGGNSFTKNVYFNGDESKISGSNTFSGSVTFNGSNIELSGANTFTSATFNEDIKIFGSNSFADFICQAPGKSFEFAADTTQTISHSFKLSGSADNHILLGGSAEWNIEPSDSALISILYVTVKNSKNLRTAPIILYSKNGCNTDGTGNTNWFFAGHEYVWTALDASSPNEWNSVDNWEPRSIPTKYADVKIEELDSENYPILISDISLANDESSAFNVDLDGDGTIDTLFVASSLSIGQNALFDFNGYNLTVNSLYNEGRIRVKGSEVLNASGESGIVNFPLDENSVLTGIIEYYDDFGSGLNWGDKGNKYKQLEFTSGAKGEESRPIIVTEKALIANGNGNSISLTAANSFGDVLTIGSETVPAGDITLSGENTFAGGLSLVSGGNIVLNGKKDSESYFELLDDSVCSKLTLKSPVILNGNVTTTESQTYRGNISLKADVDFTAGAGIIFETESAGGKITVGSESSSSAKSAVFKNEVSMACDMEIKELASLKFEDSVTTDSNLSLSVPSVDFAENAAFSQSDSTKTISLEGETVLSFKAASFEAGRLEIAQNASFTQSGENTAEQTVHGIENNGICVWDSESEGGSLVLAGSIGGDKAGEVVFNKKNVSISQSPVTIAGVFYDLEIPAGVTATNGSSLAVRRNFTVRGTYAHNDKPLTLGSITLSDGRKFASDSGRIEIESDSNLGSVTVTQETSGKTFVSEIVAISLGLNDKTPSAGKILFEKKLTAESLTNGSGSDFEIEISEACDISQAVSFGTAGKVILGSEETSECNFTGELSHTGGETRLAGKLKAASAEFARTLLTKNTVIDTGSNSVVFSGMLDSESATAPSSLVIGSETSASSAVFGGEVGSVAPLLSLEVKGNASFGGNVTTTGSQTYGGKAILEGDVVFDALDNLISFGSTVESKEGVISSLTLKSLVSLNGNVTTTGSQTYRGNISLKADVDFTAGAGIIFETESAGGLAISSVTGDKSAVFKNEVSMACDMEIKELASLKFEDSVTTDSNMSLSVPSVDFAENAAFSQSDSTKTLSLEDGTVLSFKAASFEAGRLVIAQNASFTQSGVNISPAEQTVHGIENNGICVWDSGSEGGSLVLAGSIVGDKAGEVVFNKKNVSISQSPVTIAGVFYDLEIPAGVTATNGSSLAVRRNFTVRGTYTHNDKPLTLGSITLSDGSHFVSDSGRIEIESDSNLGSVTVAQETSGKTFASEIKAISLGLNDKTPSAGKILFEKKVTAESLTNESGSGFEIEIREACDISQAVSFGTSGKVILGREETSECNFTGMVSHTRGETRLAGKLKAASAEFAKTILTKNTVIDTGSNSVVFSGKLDSESAESPSSLVIGSETSASSAVFGVEVGSLVPLLSLEVKGNASFGGNVTTTGSQTYGGRAILEGDVVFDALDNLISFGSTVESKDGVISSLTLKSPVSLNGNVTTTESQTYRGNISLKADVDFTAGSGIIFETETAGGKITVESESSSSAKSAVFKNEVSMTCDMEIKELASLSFEDSVTTDSNLSLSVPSVDFAENAVFSQSDSTKTISLGDGTVLSFKAASFEAGRLVIAQNAVFTQSGENISPAEQTVHGIENNGICVWDSGSEGGSLVLEGSIGGEKAGEVVFNKKNVSISQSPVTISGVFYDLTIPAGVTATNGSSLAVRRNFTVSGTYAHNDKPLTLGSITLSDGRKFESENNDDESAGRIEIESDSNLGSVTVAQETSGKTFVSEIKAISLGLNDKTASAGKILFEKKLTAESLTNESGSDFEIEISEACDISQAVSFGTSGKVILGREETSECNFTGELSHTGGETRLAGKLKAASAEFARTLLTKNTVIDTGSNNVVFSGKLDSESATVPSSLVIGSETSASSAVFGGEVGSVAPLLSLEVKGNASFGGSLTCQGKITFMGDVLSKASGVNLTSQESYILANGTVSRKWGAESGSLTVASDLFADISSDATLSIESDLLFSKNLVLYSGNFSAGAVNLSVSEDFAIFGSSYSADDPRYSGSDSRFAYYKYTLQDGLAYKPESGEAAFASRFATSGTKISVGKNFYANGLDFDNCSLLLPDNRNSNPSFNPSSEVTEKQWGSPYAIVFNSSISNCTAKASVDSASAFVAAATFQNVTDDSGNSGFQFDIPKIAEAYSVSDSVICISFDMALENSQKEVQKTVALVSSLLEGGIFYNEGKIAFDGIFYTKTDGTDCSIPLSDSAFASSDIPAGTKLYLKVSSLGEKWNTDATASSYGNSDSSDRGGEHHEVTTDLSMFEGLFYAAQGKTMCRNYGIGLWKDDSAYVTSKTFPTIDRARPVLIDVFTGQELYSTNTGSAESQKPYDSHNFIELRYSEPVDIGDLLSGSTSENQNIQAEKNFASSQSHGGSILKNGSGLSVTGFVSIAQGSVEAGFRDGSSHEIDTAKAHALYRKFQRNAKVAESVEPCRIRISIAGFVDIDNPVTIDGKSFNNWIGYIDSSESPAGLVQPFANSYITDLAVDAEGNALKNALDEKNSSRTITVNSASSSISSDCLPDSLYSLYGAWDCTHPSFSPYITSLSGEEGYSWTDGDSDSRTYEIVGMVDSNVSAYLDHVEFHLFDNQPEYKSGDTYKWVSQLGWMENGSELPSHIAPESTGGARPFAQGVKKSQGGIRRSSLAEAYSAFDYSYATDGIYSDYRSFNDDGIFQHVKSSLFRNKDLTVTSTNDDGLYIAMHLNSSDSKLPMRTNFIIRYYQEKSFITDLAGNRLLHSDDGSVKTLRSVDITPPSFSIVLSPVGEDKLYAVFTKPLAYDGQLLQDRADLPSVMEKIRDNLEFVYSAGDDIDTGNYVSGEDEIAITKVELASYSADYTSLLFTLDRKIRLNDVEKIWLRINEKGDEIETFSGKLTASYFRDISGNSIPYHTCHAISDFAANSVNVLYARSLSDEDEGWDEQGIYGSGVNSLASDYAAHDFSVEGGNYGKLRTGHDIIFQLQLVGGVDSDGYYGFKNDESLALVIDKKSNLRNEWISDKFNLLTKKDWRIWLDKPLPSLASSYNSSPLSRNPVFEKVTGSDLLENMTLKNDEFNFASKEEYQFFFKILDKDGNPILINHDGDKTTQKIPLYALWMPQEKISSGDFSFLDLWSFTLSSITRQRGGVTILNNVIDASVGEKTAIEVDMASSGNLNVFIMTLDGNIVQHLAKGSFKAGKHYFYWDGKNKGGSPVARGLYFVRVSGKGIDETRKVMVVK